MNKVAYFINVYPKTSHSFIRREIRTLESLGFQIHRVSLRSSPAPLVAEEDRQEAERTVQLLELPLGRLLSWMLMEIAAGPFRFFGTWLRFAFRTDNSMAVAVKSIAYVLEAAALKHYCRVNDIDHVHVHFGINSATVVMLMRQLGGPPYSVTFHGPSDFDAPLQYAIKEKVAAARFVVAISHYCVAQLRRWVDEADWEKIRIVRCTVADAFLSDEPLRDRTHTLVTVGRLTSQKGLLTLIDGMAIARDQGSQTRLVIVGDGPMRAATEKKVADYALTDQVSFVGWKAEDEIRSLLIASDGLVQPSYAEGLPVVIMEAYAVSRPVITTYIAGIPELVEDDVNGWLVPASDATKLGAAILQFDHASLEEICRFGREGYERVRELHTTSKAIPHLASLLETAS